MFCWESLCDRWFVIFIVVFMFFCVVDVGFWELFEVRQVSNNVYLLNKVMVFEFFEVRDEWILDLNVLEVFIIWLDDIGFCLLEFLCNFGLIVEYSSCSEVFLFCCFNFIYVYV